MTNFKYIDTYEDNTKVYTRQRYRKPKMWPNPLCEKRVFYNSPEKGWLELSVYLTHVFEITDVRQIKALNKLSTLIEETHM